VDLGRSTATTLNRPVNRYVWKPPGRSKSSDINKQDSQDPLPSPSTPPSRVAAIAGGVVGGVAGIAILAAATWLFIRRRKKTASNLAAISDDPSGNDAPEVVNSKMAASKWHTRAELEGSRLERQELAAERPCAELEAGTVMLVPELCATQRPHA
jgi:hypothetical protein